MMKVVQFKSNEHYDLIRGWWESRQFPPAQEELLPPTGRLIYAHDRPICAGFLIKTDAKVAIIGHLVSDPSTDREQRSIALDLLITALEIEAFKAGFKLVSASSNREHVCDRYERLGFSVYDQGVTHLGRSLECR